MRPSRTSAAKCATGRRWPESPARRRRRRLGSYMLLRWSAPLDLAALNIARLRRRRPVRWSPTRRGTRCWSSSPAATTAASLDLRLQPFAEAGTVDATLTLGQLAPGGHYELVDAAGHVVADVDADDAGTGRVVTTIDGLTALSLRPAIAPLAGLA